MHTSARLSVEVHAATARVLALTIINRSGRGNHPTGLTAGPVMGDAA